VGASAHTHSIGIAQRPVDDDGLPVGPRDRTRRTCIETRGVLAVVAEDGQEMPCRVRILAILHVLHGVSKYPEWDIEFGLASHRAGMAADAGAQIDQHPEAHRRGATIAPSGAVARAAELRNEDAAAQLAGASSTRTAVPSRSRVAVNAVPSVRRDSLELPACSHSHAPWSARQRSRAALAGSPALFTTASSTGAP